MRLPDLVAYQAAVQHPSTAFADPQLRAATVTTGHLGLPRAVAGNFAVTYQLRSGQQHWAVRCFHREAADRAPRYAAISQTLARMTSGPLVPIEYIESGVRVGQSWLPITKMAWIDGYPLNRAIESRLSDPRALKDLETRFIALVAELARHGIAHGDLQHGNILVDPSGALHLVDYDGMFVPALRGRPASESGDPNYQHPRRSSEFDAKLDRFAALVIVVALRALAAAPRLWQTYNTGDNLLFRRADLAAPEKSALFRDLAAVPSVQALSDRLALACNDGYAHIPRLADVLTPPKTTVKTSAKTPASRTIQSTRQRAWKLRRAAIQQAVAFSADGAQLASIDYDGKLTVRDSATGRTRHSVRVETAKSTVARVAFSRGGGLHVAVGSGSTVNVWDAAHRQPVREVSGGRTLTNVTLSSGGGWLAAASRGGGLRCWSMATGRLSAMCAYSGAVSALAVSADGRRLAIATPRGQLRVLQLPSGQPVSTLHVSRGMNCMAFTPDAEQLVIGTVNGSLSVWDVRSGELATEMAELDEPIESVAVSPDGKHVAASGRAGSIWLRTIPKQPVKTARLLQPRAGVIESSYRLFDWLRRVATATGSR